MTGTIEVPASGALASHRCVGSDEAGIEAASAVGLRTPPFLAGSSRVFQWGSLGDVAEGKPLTNRPRAAEAPAKGYEEQLYLPWWGWIAAVLVALVLAAIFYMGDNVWYRQAPLFLFPLMAVAGLWWLGRIRLAVDTNGGDDRRFHVDDAQLPRWAVDRIEVLRDHEWADALSVGAHPLGFVIQRPWIRSGVMIHLDDPDDPTPYWLVSSRDPEALRNAFIGEAT
ncbi:DUF3093 domain-containing protein [Haloglycomyces albus]|uniref:DUF3093 domain-containing protein n=1 Tax=Haloglycomyces albus TaxID=526067 RepID=UPI0004B41055|nr:DUF3093 domain-containing protein [Haloglycomyces albus]